MLQRRKVHLRDARAGIFAPHVRNRGFVYILPTNRATWPEMVNIETTGGVTSVEVFTGKSVLSFAGAAYALPKDK